MKRVAVALLTLPILARAQLDRAGNVIEDDSGPVPKWLLAGAGIGLLVYGLRKPSEPDAKLSIGLGCILLVGALIS